VLEAESTVERGIALSGSGVGAAFTARKVSGVRSALYLEARYERTKRFERRLAKVAAIEGKERNKRPGVTGRNAKEAVPTLTDRL
jgi:hypothetical protein